MDEPARLSRAKRAIRSRPWHNRLQLRTRVTIGFALVATALCILLTTITYLATRSSLVSQDLRSFGNTALANALIVQSQAHNFNGSLNEVDESAIGVLTDIDLSATPPTLSLLYLDNRWITDQTASVLTNADLPHSLIASTQNSTEPYEQIFSLHGSEVLGVGIPLGSVGATYYELFRPTQTEQALQTLFFTLLIASIVAIALAGLLGSWTAKRVLRPLTSVTEAALLIAGGQLDTRIETHDESDLARLAASFNRMVDQLQERLEREARFTSDVAHELRSPLTTLATSLSVLESRAANLSPRGQQALELLSSEVRRFSRMVGDLLEISRFDAGNADFQPSDVTVGEIISRALRQSGETNLELNIPPWLTDRHLVVDKRRFGRIIANLIENARRYADGPTRVTVKSNGEDIRFVVEDDGPGVPESEREHIFERFARGASAAGSRGSGNGTGLGLALVREHVKLHNGTVWVEGGREGGSRFVVQLPLGSGLTLLGDDDADGLLSDSMADQPSSSISLKDLSEDEVGS